MLATTIKLKINQFHLLLKTTTKTTLPEITKRKHNLRGSVILKPKSNSLRYLFSGESYHTLFNWAIIKLLLENNFSRNAVKIKASVSVQGFL